MISAIFFASSALAYGLCDRTNYPYAGKNVSIPIVPTLTKSMTIDSVVHPITVSGTLHVIDGCSFEITNFKLDAPAAVKFYWHGAQGEIDLNGENLTRDSPVDSATTDAVYQFVSTAGDAVRYDFKQFNLYDPETRSVIAQAVLPVTSAPAASAAPVVAPATTIAPVATTVPESNKQGESASSASKATSMFVLLGVIGYFVI